MSGVTTVQDGTPLTITDALRRNDFRRWHFPRPDVPWSHLRNRHDLGITCIQPEATTSTSSAFCTADLPQIGNGTGFGNSGVGILLGPGQFNFDFSLVKTTRIKERQALIFRAEAFNLFNHPQFLTPANLAVSTPQAFGEITGTSVNPRILQLGLKYIF